MSTNFIITIVIFLLTCALQLSSCSRGRVLHQPFFPLASIPPAPSPASPPKPPQPQKQEPKLPFSNSPAAPGGGKSPFFPSDSSPPPPPPPSSSVATTFPANISSLVLPQTPTPRKPFSTKLLASVAAAVLSVTLVSVLILIFYYQRHRRFVAAGKAFGSDSLRLYPANSDGDTGSHKPQPQPPPPPPRGGASSGTSTEFLYLGTLVNSRGGGVPEENNAATTDSTTAYQKLGSPELRPLPPLPRQNVQASNQNDDEAGSALSDDGDQQRQGEEGEEEEEEEEEEFYSPGGSSTSKERAFQAVQAENFGSRSCNSPTPSYSSSKSASPTHHIFSSTPSSPLNSSPTSSNSKPPFLTKFLAPPLRPPPPPPPRENAPSFLPSPGSSLLERESPVRISDFSIESPKQSPERMMDVFSGQDHRPQAPRPPPPPPPPPHPHPWGHCETTTLPAVTTISGPPVLVPPPRPIVFQHAAPLFSAPGESQNSESVAKSDDTPKLKLKPLHWDKVRASSNRAMVWDQLKSSSFKLNEEMIETLFMVNGSNLDYKDNLRRAVLPMPNQENQVLDPKKSQNIAILLRALNVTIDEVCEALLEGNADTLGTELLESLLKMAPTKEEERKLKEFKDESPIKLGPAEKFLKAVIDIPYAFKRVDAMLYIANFDSEVEYLKRSFETLEAACEELRKSRMFLKLLEAVLKTGNRMNVGTNRGDAHAFKLDTLLKLVDVKGADGKTTLLHFVVQEIIRAEGSRLSGCNQKQSDDKTQQSALWDDIEYRKLGLQVVSSLSGELTNVRKAAVMDADVLGNDVGKLAVGISKVREVLKLIEELALKESSQNFCQSMNGFLHKAGEELTRIEAQENASLSLVKELTVYFHGNSAKEEAHPFRIFTVVRDFLSTLDHVCREVGKINERNIVSSSRQFPLPLNPGMPPVFAGCNSRQQYISSDDESSSSSSL